MANSRPKKVTLQNTFMFWSFLYFIFAKSTRFWDWKTVQHLHTQSLTWKLKPWRFLTESLLQTGEKIHVPTVKLQGCMDIQRHNHPNHLDVWFNQSASHSFFEIPPQSQLSESFGKNHGTPQDPLLMSWGWMVSSTIVSIYDILGILQNSTKNYWPKCRPNEAYKTSNNFQKRPISCAEKNQFFLPQPPSAVVVEGSGTEERGAFRCCSCCWGKGRGGSFHLYTGTQKNRIEYWDRPK